MQISNEKHITLSIDDIKRMIVRYLAEYGHVGELIISFNVGLNLSSQHAGPSTYVLKDVKVKCITSVEEK